MTSHLQYSFVVSATAIKAVYTAWYSLLHIHTHNTFKVAHLHIQTHIEKQKHV